MNALNTLRTALIDISLATGEEIPLIIGGGFGLYLRQEQLRESEDRALFSELPQPRATNDIDVFVRMDVLTNVERVKTLQQKIEQLDYEPVEGAKYFQWVKRGPEEQEVKIDILCGPIAGFSASLHTNSLPRVRPKAPKGTLRFHARQTEEAVELDTRAVNIEIEGQSSIGETRTISIQIPHPFTYLLMKLYAFDDRKDDEEKDVGRHHAMDLYRIVAMMNDTEYEEAKALSETHRADQRLKRAQQIVSENFHDSSALGMLRLREHQLHRDEFPHEDFIDVLKEIFGLPGDQ